MSKQVLFFATINDITEFLAYAEQHGCDAIPEVIPTDSEPIVVPPTKFPLDNPGTDFFYLLPGEFSVVEAFYQALEFEPELSKLLSRTSPVIEFSPGFVCTTEPVEGRIYISQDTSDARFRITNRLYNQLRNWIARNWTKTEDGKFFLGRQATDLCRSGKSQISYGGKMLQPKPI